MYVCLFRAHGTDRVAYVSTQPSSSAGVMVQVSRGKKRASVSAKLYGPFDDAEAATVFQRELDALLAEGFVASGLGALLSALDSKKRKKRALAAIRLAWLKQAAAVEPLLELAKKATEELPTVVDALGELGDARAIPVARAAAEKKLLSRRRAGVEALWKLGDSEGLADAKNRALERLPQAVRDVLAQADLESEHELAIAPLVAATAAVPVKDRGLVLDTLYELRTPLTVITTRRLLAVEPIAQPHLWRYAKSILKRAMLRFDFATFGILAHRIEILRKTESGTVASVKSGYDGDTKKMRIFSKKTQLYMIRALWRYLVRLARHRPLWYAHAAAEVLVHYSPTEEDAPRALSGRYAGLYLFSRIVFGSSVRFKVDHRALRLPFKDSKSAKVPAGVREEAYPGAWDASPDAYLRILSGASLALVHEIGLRGVKAHPEILASAPNATIVAMVGVTHPATVDLGLAELRRRFDPGAPNVEILRLLLSHHRPNVKALGLEWLEASRAVWTRDAVLVLGLLASPDGEIRSTVAEQAARALVDAPADVREAIARGVWDELQKPEQGEGGHDAYGRLGQLLAQEIATLVPVTSLVARLANGSPAARGVALAAISRKPDAVTLLGIDRLLLLAADETGGVRAAAFQLLELSIDELNRDPSGLFGLIELPFPDTRRFAKEMLATKVKVGAMSFEALLGLCDSNVREAQDLGKELIQARLSELPPERLIAALSQHPHRNIQRFALDLVVSHLQQGFTKLAALEQFFRSVLLDVVPDRKMKRTVLDFLAVRGVTDENQAEVAARLLAELAKSRTLSEAERAMVALAKIKIAFPEVQTPTFELAAG